MTTAKLPLKVWLLFFSQVHAAVAQDAGDSDARTLSAALQNINGMSSVISLLPVLTGKTQNVKAVAARTFPASLSVTGLGAGRVLSKMQIGIMLLSADLYRNLVGDLSYYHQEYVNAFAPALIHIPTGTPERHSANAIVNHNMTEDYMVEAWFQTQGLPAAIEMKQNSNRRLFCGILVYLAMYAFETFLCVQNAATGTGLALIAVQIVSGLSWIVAVCVLQVTRGQGKRVINVNRLATADYRCYQLVVSGKHVHSALLSTQLSNIREYNLFNAKYENKRLKGVGGAIIVSGIIDIFATVFVVGLNVWAYGWLGLQVFLVAVKVLFSLEPIRRISIVSVHPLAAESQNTVLASGRQKTRLPLTIISSPDFSFAEVWITHNVVREGATDGIWHSRTPGIFIGQPYYLRRALSDAENVAKGPKARDDSFEKQAPALELAKAKASLPLSRPASAPNTSPTSSEPSRSSIATIFPSLNPAGSPRTPAESLLTASPISPVAPPGIPLARSTSSHSTVTRVPTPTVKPPTRAATFPLSPVSPNAPSQRLRHTPLPARTLNASPSPEIKLQESSLPIPTPKEIDVVRYLALNDDKLTLSEIEPAREANQALQREFLACLAEVVRANKVPSLEFLHAVETMRDGIRETMTDNWYTFGTSDLMLYLRTAHLNLLWHQFV